MWYTYVTFARHGWIQTWSGDEHFSQSSWDQLLSPVSSFLPARQTGVTQMVFSCQCRSIWALTSWHGPKSICRAAWIRWERNAYFLLFRKWHGKYRYQEIKFPTVQHFMCYFFKQLMMYCNPDIWTSVKHSLTMTLLLFDASSAFAKLFLQQLLLEPGQVARAYVRSMKSRKKSAMFLLPAGVFFILQLQSLLSPKIFLQDTSGPTW